ncbi:CapA family protein [Adlercreutzia muris]|uniref:CapA family protein n=1 Tax=Adlercreutzia muris TaxID=1796610 RepID=UPI001094D3BF|nr:CapA family protein [Adlercreutzia muris]NCA31439.1 CapA family protein [Adlercreutzia muris]TGY72428.1 CapA family protein [Enterorhabdus sp. NM05_H27]
MSILIGADIVPTKSNYELFENADVNSLIGSELVDVLAGADFRIFNLEVPLADASTPIEKGGHNMIAPTATVAGVKAIGADLLTLCNNHILDQGSEGLGSTISCLDDMGISHVGVGANLEAAREPFFFTQNGRRFGVYACAEHEYSIAGPDAAGANPFDPLESLDHIEEAKRECDYLIVLYHGGKEHYRYPSPNLQHACRRFVDKGADLVVCQHSHCVGCEERYRDAVIVYGQGNFLFDLCNNEYWDSSVLVRISDDLEIDYLPLVRRGNGVRLAEGEEARSILDGLSQRSREIQREGFVESHFRSFAKRATGYYFLEFTGRPLSMFVFRVFNKLSKQHLMENYAFSRHYRGRHWKAVRNYIECETHRELILSALIEDDE